jgi:ABC-2 type transport system ATP-binding protein
MAKAAIAAVGVRKSYGKVQALRGVDLAVEPGTIVGLLGPNGAGKTTLVRIFTTLLRADGGVATVAGLDAAREPAAVRAKIGLAGQSASVDEHLTGRENIELAGRLHHIGRASSAKRAAELLSKFDLLDAADRPTRTYSGGMRRRLDLAASIVSDPPILFLDEPTTGLDPRSRLALWDIIDDLRRDGKTILLTTQYLEEADRLADRIAVVDHGVVIAEGRASELKAKVGGDVVEGVAATLGDFERLPDVMPSPLTRDAARLRFSVPAQAGAKTLLDVMQRLESSGIRVSDLGLRRPSLDDVFLAITGRASSEETEPKAPALEAKA